MGVEIQYEYSSSVYLNTYQKAKKKKNKKKKKRKVHRVGGYL